MISISEDVSKQDDERYWCTVHLYLYETSSLPFRLIIYIMRLLFELFCERFATTLDSTKQPTYVQGAYLNTMYNVVS